jgi:hypothetical protein
MIGGAWGVVHDRAWTIQAVAPPVGIGSDTREGRGDPAEGI